MKLNLIVTDGAHKGKAIPVTKREFLIGRDPKCHLRPSSGAVSKRHCTLIYRDGKLFVRDLNSTNGTFINDKQIQGEHELHHEDKLSVGPLGFIVQMEGMPAASTATKSTAPAATKSSKAMDDEAVADMLLLLDEQEESGSSDLLDENIPSGSTMMDMIAPLPEEIQRVEEERKKAAAAELSKYDQAKQAQADTSKAAKDILQQYSRRRP
jgi:predicted component of type VI protein secretion system